MVINENAKRKVLPIASGKGGVGKTIIAANLALDLASNNKKTVVVDLDLGGANLHTVLGIKNINPGIGNFLSGRGVKFNNIITPTPYENLSLIAGDVLVPGMADIPFSQKKKLLSSILSLDTEYIILDLGSGSNFHVIDYFLMSNSGFLVVRGQKASMLNTYGFLKNLVFRFLQRAFASQKDISRYLKKVLKEKRPNATPAIKDIIKKIRKINRSAGDRAKRYLSALHPLLLINMAESPEDLQMVEPLRELIRENLEIEVGCMGLIYNDKSVDASLAGSRPLMISHPGSMAAKEIARISQKILQSDNFPEMPLDIDSYTDSFELAQIEAYNDYEELQLLTKPEEEFNARDMLAIISEQKKKIDELQGTVRMLTIKNR